MAVHTDALDVELRRRIDPVTNALGHVAFDAGDVDVASDLVDEPAGVQVQFLGVADKRIKVQAGGGAQQQFVHVPELALGASRLRSLGRLLRVRVQLRDGEVPEHEPDGVRIAAEQLMDVACRSSAVRALIVAVLKDRDRRVRQTAQMIISGDGGGGELLGRASHVRRNSLQRPSARPHAAALHADVIYVTSMLRKTCEAFPIYGTLML